MWGGRVRQGCRSGGRRSVEHHLGHGELSWALEHERDTSQNLRRKDLRCGSRGSRGGECTHEFAQLYAHRHARTHLLQHAHVQTDFYNLTYSLTQTHSNLCVHTETLHALMQANTLRVHIGPDTRCSRWYTTPILSDPQSSPLRAAHGSTAHTSPGAPSQRSTPCSVLSAHTPGDTHVSLRTHTRAHAASGPRASLRPRACGWPMRAQRVLSPRQPVELSGSGLGRGEGVAMGTSLTSDPCAPRPSVFFTGLEGRARLRAGVGGVPQRRPDIEPKANPNDAGSPSWARAGEHPGQRCPVWSTQRGLWEDLALKAPGGASMIQLRRLSPEESEELALASFLFLKCPSFPLGTSPHVLPSAWDVPYSPLPAPYPLTHSLLFFWQTSARGIGRLPK